MPKTDNAIFLTFDDGPIPELTTWVLQTLKKYNAKATFFCVGENVKKYPDIYSEILHDGHSVGNHTFSHLNGWKCKTNHYVSDFEKANEFIKSNLFRPPYGKIKNGQKNYISKNKKIIFWDVLSKDYDKNTNKEQCFENIKKYTSAGSIVVFHDNIKAEKNMKYALCKTLDNYSEKNMNFKNIEF